MSKKQLDLAEAQLLGWHLGRWGANADEICSQMGLTEEEWKILKKDYLLVLDDEEKEEIDKYFEEKK